MEETLRRVDDLLARALAVGERLFRGGKLSDATRERQAIFDEWQALLAYWLAAHVAISAALKAAGSQLALPDSTAIEDWLFDYAWTEAKGDARERRFAEWASKYRDLAAPLSAVGEIASPSRDERKREPDADFIFRRDGDGYYIKAFGESGRVAAKGAKGLHDLFRLIKAAPDSVRMADLLAEGVRPDRLARPEDEGDGFSVGESGQEAMDSRARREAMNEIRRLDAEIAELEREQPVGWELMADELRAKRDELRRYVDAATNIRGESRRFRGELDRMRSAVHARLKRAVDAIRAAGLRATADHLANSCGAEGGSFRYFGGVDWQTGENQ